MLKVHYLCLAQLQRPGSQNKQGGKTDRATHKTPNKSWESSEERNMVWWSECPLFVCIWGLLGFRAHCAHLTWFQDVETRGRGTGKLYPRRTKCCYQMHIPAMVPGKAGCRPLDPLKTHLLPLWDLLRTAQHKSLQLWWIHKGMLSLRLSRLPGATDKQTA